MWGSTIHCFFTLPPTTSYFINCMLLLTLLFEVLEKQKNKQACQGESPAFKQMIATSLSLYPERPCWWTIQISWAPKIHAHSLNFLHCCQWGLFRNKLTRIGHLSTRMTDRGAESTKVRQGEQNDSDRDREYFGKEGLSRRGDKQREQERRTSSKEQIQAHSMWQPLGNLVHATTGSLETIWQGCSITQPVQHMQWINFSLSLSLSLFTCRMAIWKYNKNNGNPSHS